jgi:predicted nucleotidyltransferase
MALAPASLRDIEPRLRRTLEAERHVRWAYLFGSAGRGGPFADLDVAVVLSGDARGPLPLGRVVSALEEAVPEVRIDVVDALAAAPAVAGRIVREGRLLVDREPDARVCWEIETNRRALDIEPWMREFERLRNESLRARMG